MIAPIRTEEQRRAKLARIDQLMQAEEGSPESAKLQLLAILAERYEREALPIDVPLAAEAIRFCMEQMGYTQTDLARLLGSRSLGNHDGQDKNLSIAMIRRLHDRWRIPAEALIGRAA